MYVCDCVCIFMCMYWCVWCVDPLKLGLPKICFTSYLLTSFDISQKPVTRAVLIYPGLFLTLVGFVVSCSAIFIDSLELFIDNESYSFDNEDIHWQCNRQGRERMNRLTNCFYSSSFPLSRPLSFPLSAPSHLSSHFPHLSGRGILWPSKASQTDATKRGQEEHWEGLGTQQW